MDSIQKITELIKRGNYQQLKTTLDKNPSLAGTMTGQGISLLQLAVYYSNKSVVETIRSFLREITLHEAASLGELDATRKLIENQPELINSFSPDGFTPLGLACFFGQLEVVKFLLENGANPNLTSNNSFQVAPIHSACAISHFEIAAILIAHGADVNAKQAQGYTPLHSAAHNGKTELVKLLVDNNANTNAKTDSGQTPLEMALEKNFVETAVVLMKSGGV